MKKINIYLFGVIVRMLFSIGAILTIVLCTFLIVDDIISHSVSVEMIFGLLIFESAILFMSFCGWRNGIFFDLVNNKVIIRIILEKQEYSLDTIKNICVEKESNRLIFLVSFNDESYIQKISYYSPPTAGAYIISQYTRISEQLREFFDCKNNKNMF